MKKETEKIIAERIIKDDKLRIKQFKELPERFLNWFIGNGKVFTYKDFDIEKSHEICLKNKDVLFPSQCHSNSMLIGLSGQVDVYIGYILRDEMVPIPHAWTVKDGKIIDPTLGIKQNFGYDNAGTLQTEVTDQGKSPLEYGEERMKRLYTKLVGVKIPAKFMQEVYNYKIQKFDHVQNFYLFEWYMINVLKKNQDEAIFHAGFGKNGAKKWFKKFKKIMENTK